MTAPQIESAPEGLDPNSPEYLEWVKGQFRKIGFTEMPGDEAGQLIGQAE